MDELIKEINYLANKKKTEGLTEQELERQKELRQKYLKIFREGMRGQLESIKVVDEFGNEIQTKRKVKRLH